MPLKLLKYPSIISDKFFVPDFKYVRDMRDIDKRFLEQYGTKLKALEDGSLLPQTDDERHFVAVCAGEEKPRTRAAKVWRKFRLRQKKEKIEKDSFRDGKAPVRKAYLKSRMPAP